MPNSVVVSSLDTSKLKKAVHDNKESVIFSQLWTLDFFPEIAATAPSHSYNLTEIGPLKSKDLQKVFNGTNTPVTLDGQMLPCWNIHIFIAIEVAP